MNLGRRYGLSEMNMIRPLPPRERRLNLARLFKARHYPKLSRFAIAGFRPGRAVDIIRWRQLIGIYTNNGQPNPAGGSRGIVPSRPTEDWKDCLNPTTGRWWMVQVLPARSITENEGWD